MRGSTSTCLATRPHPGPLPEGEGESGPSSYRIEDRPQRLVRVLTASAVLRRVEQAVAVGVEAAQVLLDRRFREAAADARDELVEVSRPSPSFVQLGERRER